MRTGGGGGAVLRRWRGAVGGVMVVGLVVAAGCAQEREGGLGVDDLPDVSGTPAEAEVLLLDAVDRTMAVESVDMSSTVDMGLGGFEVDYDWTSGGVGEIAGTLRAFGGVVTFEARSDGTTAWLRTDDADVVQLLPPGVSWIEGPRDEVLTDGTASMSEGLWALLLFLRGAESVEPGGIESVGGADVRMVSGTIDRDAAFAAATVDEQLLMDDASSSSSAGERFEFELGIDRDRRIRSLEYTITPSDDEGLGIQVRLRLEVRRFDHPVEPPEHPPTGETISIYAIPGGPGALTDDD